jgi:hypothetical protein
MSRALVNFTLFVCLFALPTPSWAQGRVPAADSGAIGGDIGVFLPASDELDSSLALEGFYEYYFTPRASMRVGAGWTNPAFERGSDDNFRTVRVAIDGVYNWEGGQVHPFVGAGLGIYFLQPTDNGESVGDSETKPGATLFGGVEIFTSRTAAIKAEGRYHIIGDAFGLDPGGFTLTIGLKTYF